MSLRTRLTLLYTSLLGGVLLLFGASVYALLSVLLVRQVDATLVQTAQNLIASIQVSAVGNVQVLSLPNLDFTANVFVQVWSPTGELQQSSPNLGAITTPLDPVGLRQGRPTLRQNHIGKARLRVLTVPLELSGRPVAVLQVAALLTSVDQARRVLVTALGTALLLSVGLALLGGEWAIRRELAPLEEAIRIAQIITETGDPSRRIPLPRRHQGDELGALIQAFNATLARLEHQFAVERHFLADVSHELRTPLTVIKGNVQLMRRLGEADPEALQSIEQETDRLTRLVEQLLFLAQAESGHLPLQRQPVPLEELVLEVTQEVRVLARKKPHLRLWVDPLDSATVCGDRDRLKQMILNLLSNAIKYTPDGGEVRVGLSSQGGEAILEVQDTGPGIPPEDLPYLFERFYRVDRARQRAKGFGLGLSITYWIVQHHQGSIDVTSRPGEGTLFTVRLPLIAKDQSCDEENAAL